MNPEKTPGQINFEAYAASVGGRTYDNKPIPAWEALSSAVREAWEEGAKAVAEHTLRGRIFL